MRISWVVAVLFVCVLGFSSLVNAAPAPELELHGWMLTRYYFNASVDAYRDVNGEISNVEKDDFLELAERISLSGTAKFANGKVGYGEIYIHPWLPESDPSFLYLESLYLDVPAEDGSKVRIGKGRNMAFGLVPTYGNRKTSNYSPVSEAFTQDRVLGVQYMRTKGPDYFAFAVLNSQRAGSRFIGMTADKQLDARETPGGSLPFVTTEHLVDRDAPANRSDTLQISSRYAHQMGNVNLGVSGRIGQLDDDDVAFLARKFPTYSGNRKGGEDNKDLSRYGADLTYKKTPFVGIAQYYKGDTGGIETDGWEVTVGVEPSKSCHPGLWREFSNVCKGLYVRYGELNVDVPKTTSTISWPTKQLAVTYVIPLKSTGLVKWIQLEYERNKEEPIRGADEIPNDIFFVELFTSF